VYARVPGAVAAPTAGLHFDQATLAALEAKGVRLARVTLHVGAGTFLPVRDGDLDTHRMHAERYTIPASTVAAIEKARAAGGPGAGGGHDDAAGARGGRRGRGA
jgi:S-adenosylmethionine:tRNA ribosyltransferase-isomerase